MSTCGEGGLLGNVGSAYLLLNCASTQIVNLKRRLGIKWRAQPVPVQRIALFSQVFPGRSVLAVDEASGAASSKRKIWNLVMHIVCKFHNTWKSVRDARNGVRTPSTKTTGSLAEDEERRA